MSIYCNLFVFNDFLPNSNALWLRMSVGSVELCCREASCIRDFRGSNNDCSRDTGQEEDEGTGAGTGVADTEAEVDRQPNGAESTRTPYHLTAFRLPTKYLARSVLMLYAF